MESTLELLECPMTMLTVQNSDGSPYISLQEVSSEESHHNILSSRSPATMITSQGLMPTSHHNLVTTYTHVDTMGLNDAAVATGTSMSASHSMLSALLTGQITSDNSQGVE
jgi:hypothetical protein